MMGAENTYPENTQVAAAIRVDSAALQKGLAFSFGTSFQGAGRGGSEGGECQDGENGRFEKLHRGICEWVIGRGDASGDGENR